MEASEAIESTTRASSSPNGHYIAGLTSDHLYIYYRATLTPAASFPLDNTNIHTTRSTETPSLHWTPSSLAVILQTNSHVSLYSLANTASRVKIANGSAGLGRIAAVDVLGENVVVIWEFGRVGLFEVSRGRVTEVGELKTGIGSLRAAWGIRRLEGKAEVLAMLCRTSATDMLSLMVPSSTTPFKTTALQTTDAQSLAWSPNGTWLSILDSSLSTPLPAIHIYTADGNFFRSYPATATSDEDTPTLGPLRQSWGPKHLALANADGSINLLSTTTFCSVALLDPRNADMSKTVYREQVSAKGEHSWTYLGSGDDTTTAILSSYSPAVEMNFDAGGTLIATRCEAFPETVIIWTIPSSKPMMRPAADETAATTYEIKGKGTTILHHHSPIRKLHWHPTHPGLLLTHTEDGNLFLFDAQTTAAAPTHLTHPFSSNSSASTSTSTSTASPATTDTKPHWLPTASVLLTSRKRGWLLLYPFGRPADPSPADLGQSATGTEEEVDDSQDSLYDILSGRTPLPGLRISDGDGEEERDGEESQRLDDTFRGKGTVGTVESFEY